MKITCTIFLTLLLMSTRGEHVKSKELKLQRTALKADIIDAVEAFMNDSAYFIKTVDDTILTDTVEINVLKDTVWIPGNWYKLFYTKIIDAPVNMYHVIIVNYQKPQKPLVILESYAHIDDGYIRYQGDIKKYSKKYHRLMHGKLKAYLINENLAR